MGKVELEMVKIMDKYIKCYVLYCIEDKTYLSSMSFWNDNVLQAVKYKDINRAKEAQSHYDKTVKIMELSITINGVILS
ncbi:hypothetical protein [Clostridium taeniosporum]|nr:hypothetical protein [Clostridium taeniosporum]